jgi:hypothetical protein
MTCGNDEALTTSSDVPRGYAAPVPNATRGFIPERQFYSPMDEIAHFKSRLDKILGHVWLHMPVPWNPAWLAICSLRSVQYVGSAEREITIREFQRSTVVAR